METITFTRVAIVIFTALTISSCATPPPAQQAIQKSKVISKSFDATWANIISVFAENNIGIQTLEKDSGIIVAETEYTTPENLDLYATCQSGPLETILTNKAKFNVFSRKISDTETRVQVNAVYNRTTLGQLSNQTFNRICVSNGTLEQKILDAAAQ